MNIEDFIAETITGIVKGIAKADKEVAEIGGVVNPMKDLHGHHNSGNRMYNSIQDIQMSFAITSTNTSDNGTGKAGISVSFFNAGIESGKTGNSNESSNTVKFTIPVLFPPGGKT